MKDKHFKCKCNIQSKYTEVIIFNVEVSLRSVQIEKKSLNNHILWDKYVTINNVYAVQLKLLEGFTVCAFIFIIFFMAYLSRLRKINLICEPHGIK